ncbi:MAG: glycosyltransferase family 39 protein [Candidatus Omnitrophota bacterium]|jgi:4-amino-4-deoxy-L-arabinose transferase-like glycosyltransferase
MVLAISITALALRLYHLGANDLWYDEVYSVLISRDSFSIWNPPIYFAVLHYWIKLFGVSEFSLRFPSLIFSVLSIPFVFLLGKTVFNRRVGFYASVIMCLSSFHLWYAQEARPYSLSVLLSIMSTYYLYRFLKEERIGLGIVYALVSVFGLYSDVSHYHLFLLLIQLFSVAILTKRRNYLKLFLIFCAISLVFALRLEYFISKLAYIKNGFWIPSPSLKSLLFTLENFNLGYNVSIWLYWFSDFLVLIIFGFVFLALWKEKENRRRLIFMLLLAFLPLGLAYGFSKIFFSVYLDRAFIVFSPYYYLLIGFGLNYLKNKWLKMAILFACLVALFISLSSYYRNLMPVGPDHHSGVTLKKSFKPVLRFIEDNFQPGDRIMHTNSSPREIFGFYSRNKEVRQDFLFTSKMVDSDWNRPYRQGLGVLNVDDLDYVNFRRIWVVSCDWQRGEKLDKNSEAVNSEMRRKYKLDLSLEFDGLWIYRYLKI